MSLRFNVCVLAFFFFRSAFLSFSVGLVHCSQNLQTSFFTKTFIKNGSHDIIHTFENYFATVFSIFSKIRGIQTHPKCFKFHPRCAKVQLSHVCSLITSWILVPLREPMFSIIKKELSKFNKLFSFFIFGGGGGRGGGGVRFSWLTHEGLKKILQIMLQRKVSNL